jgi:hypothetical protein
MSEQAKSGSVSEKRGSRPYQAPRLGRVDLEAEEVLGVGCKLSTISVGSGSPINCVVKACSKPLS